MLPPTLVRVAAERPGAAPAVTFPSGACPMRGGGEAEPETAPARARPSRIAPLTNAPDHVVRMLMATSLALGRQCSATTNSAGGPVRHKRASPRQSPGRAEVDAPVDRDQAMPLLRDGTFPLEQRQTKLAGVSRGTSNRARGWKPSQPRVRTPSSNPNVPETAPPDTRP